MLDKQVAEMTRTIASENGDMLPAPVRDVETWRSRSPR
jgi:hypothetical protein